MEKLLIPFCRWGPWSLEVKCTVQDQIAYQPKRSCSWNQIFYFIQLCVHGCTWCLQGGQETTCRSGFFPLCWVPGVEELMFLASTYYVPIIYSPVYIMCFCESVKVLEGFTSMDVLGKTTSINLSSLSWNYPAWTCTY